MAEPQTVHLIDASPYIFRAFFSLPTSITDAEGRPANAVRGFGDFLCRYAEQELPTHVALCFDRSLNSSFRNEFHPGYKASRELPDPDLEAQLTACEALGAALGLACFVDERYEADDLIATLVHQLRRKGHGAVVVTSDKDLAQLVDERVSLYDFARDERYGPAEAEARWGVPPARLVEYQALAGDPVDDIPGVKGVGAKTAAALIAAFGDLETLYGDLDAVADLPLRGARTLGAKLEAGREAAFLSRRLATLSRDAPARADLRVLQWRGADADTLDPLLERLALTGLRGRVPRWKGRR